MSGAESDSSVVVKSKQQFSCFGSIPIRKYGELLAPGHAERRKSMACADAYKNSTLREVSRSVIEPAEAPAATAQISTLSLPGLSTITVYA